MINRIILFLFQLNIAQAYSLTGKTNDDEHSMVLERPSNKFYPLYQDQGTLTDNSDEDYGHDLEKRRFNAWAGKRSLIGKRRFNAWAGRRR